MRILGLETSEYVSSIALYGEGGLLGEHSFPSRMNLCETLTARVQQLLSVARACEAALDGLAVSLGPGSFTGLRVGVATAKALAHVCRLPLVGVPTQQVIAAGSEVPEGSTLCVVQKARRGHLYAGLWERTADGAEALAPLEVVATESLPTWLAGRTATIVGPAADELAPLLAEFPDDLTLQTLLPQAAIVARLGGGLLPGADPAAATALQPLYVLASQAERQKNIDVTTAAPRPKLHLRRAVLADLRDVMRIENASFSSPWSEVSIREELHGRPGSVFLVLQCDGETVGYVGAWTFAGETHICTIAVAPEQRRRGLAELLMLALLRYSVSMNLEYAILEYRVSNKPAAELYSKLGFQYVHTRKRYYQDNGEDAIVAALSDLGTPERQRRLQDLYDLWVERHPCEVSFEI